MQNQNLSKKKVPIKFSGTLKYKWRIQPRMMAATFNGNPKATIISCYSPTNVSEENEIATFYEDLSSLVSPNPSETRPSVKL